MGKTGLLISTNPRYIRTILPLVHKYVKETLYIQIMSSMGDPFDRFFPNIFNGGPRFNSQTVHGVYSQATLHCQDLDVRVLLTGILDQEQVRINTFNSIDVIIFDKLYGSQEVEVLVNNKIGSLSKAFNVVTLNCDKLEANDVPEETTTTVPHVVLGGTFDRLHVAHKVLLSDAILYARSKVTIGVTAENMLTGKILKELIQDVDVRRNNVESFLKEVGPGLDYDIVTITDPFGPAIHDPTMDLIILSEETAKGGQRINEIRALNNLPLLQVVQVELMDDPQPLPGGEKKISSGNLRMRCLGSLLKPVTTNLPTKNPYIIGLTGGIASGKSGVAKWLSHHGAQVINCDLVGHDVYKPGMDCFNRVVDAFGKHILTSEGQIDRKILGSIVFKEKEKLLLLNSIVWPAIAIEANKLIKASKSRVIVVEAAVLLQAGWENMCHEIWSTFVPREEATKRLVSRNGFSHEDASLRIDAQPTNMFYIERANVIFCPLWEVEHTKFQVDKAWDLLQKRMLC